MYFTYECNRDDRVSRLPKRGYERIRFAVKGRHKVILHFATSLSAASGRAGVRRDMKKCRKGRKRAGGGEGGVRLKERAGIEGGKRVPLLLPVSS